MWDVHYFHQKINKLPLLMAVTGLWWMVNLWGRLQIVSVWNILPVVAGNKTYSSVLSCGHEKRTWFQNNKNKKWLTSQFAGRKDFLTILSHHQRKSIGHLMLEPLEPHGYSVLKTNTAAIHATDPKQLVEESGPDRSNVMYRHSPP